MPIYSNDLLAMQYKMATKIPILEFEKLVKKFNKAKKEFPYKNKYYFLKTVEETDASKLAAYGDRTKSKEYSKRKIRDNWYIDEMKEKAPFVATFYNDPKYAIPDALYINMMESLIFHANKLLNSSSKYKFDIGGSWVNGKVIIMEKK